MVASGFALSWPAMSGAEPWIGSYSPLPFGVERGRRQHPDRAREHRRLVREDVAEQVAGHDDVELLRVLHELHRGVVDVHVGQRDVRIVGGEPRDRLAPEDARVEHVRLVDGRQALAALARRLEAHPRDALDLRHAVVHRVEAFVRARRVAPAAARLPEVDVARELAHDEHVEPGNDLGLERRRRRELGIEERRPQVREQRQRLADAQEALLGPHLARQRVVLRAADRAHEDRIRRPGQRRAWRPAADRPRRRSPRRRSAAVSVDSGSPSPRRRSSTRWACPTISGPMPSPGNTAIRTSVLPKSREAAPGLPWRRFSNQKFTARGDRPSVSSRRRESPRHAPA